ncbi:MFS transporter [Xanthomonas cerealis pv. cerealis]|nr:MFS transporter [Xanthomonas translucens]QDI03771.1 MFS transporter [Xanthomonas translucens pv. cerealis]QSQ35278.1 MFS transporter [Xanthomonas translucens pv. translucens]QSQ44090.1 MFS transporter [Xanthomonas translucens pv. translucens]
MSAILLGVAVAILDASMVNTALPRIAAQLGIPSADSIFVVSAYQVSMVASLLLFSALGDIFGYKVIYIIGTIAFSISALACSAVFSFDYLVLIRAIQGLGGGAMAGVNIAIMRGMYPAHLFGRAVGTSALVVALSFCAGPLISSLILSYGSWSLIFVLNFLIGATACLLATIFLPSRPHKNLSCVPWMDLLVIMAGLFLIAFSVSALGVSRYGKTRFIISATTCCLGIGIILWNPGSFKKFLPNPYSKKIFIVASFITLLAYMAQGATLISLPFFFSAASVGRLSGTVSAMVFWSLFSGFFSYFSGRASDVLNSAHLLVMGLFIMSIGIAFLAAVGAIQPMWLASLCAAMAGAGFGIFQTPNLKLLLSYSSAQESGRSNGVLATVRLLGQMIGGVIAAAFLSLNSQQGARWALIASSLCAFLACGLANLQRETKP